MSILKHTSGNSIRKIGKTLSKRRSSSSSEIAVEPGRVDSAPMSIISAPSLIISLTPAIAASTSKKSPPSEKESGVKFKIPIIKYFFSSKSFFSLVIIITCIILYYIKHIISYASEFIEKQVLA